MNIILSIANINVKVMLPPESVRIVLCNNARECTARDAHGFPCRVGPAHR